MLDMSTTQLIEDRLDSTPGWSYDIAEHKDNFGRDHDVLTARNEQNGVTVAITFTDGDISNVTVSHTLTDDPVSYVLDHNDAHKAAHVLDIIAENDVTTMGSDHG